MNRNVTKKLQNLKKNSRQFSLDWLNQAFHNPTLGNGTHGVSCRKPWNREPCHVYLPHPQPPQTLSPCFEVNPQKKRSPIVNKFTLLICLVLSFNNRGCQANYRVPRHAAMWAIRQSEHGEEFPCPVISGSVPRGTRCPGPNPSGIRSGSHHEHHRTQWWRGGQWSRVVCRGIESVFWALGPSRLN